MKNTRYVSLLVLVPNTSEISGFSAISETARCYIPQPTLRNLPGFIQCPEQIKIQDFCPVRSVKTLDKSILSRLARINKLQQYTVFFYSLCKRQ
jgi:hypothetical protein